MSTSDTVDFFFGSADFYADFEATPSEYGNHPADPESPWPAVPLRCRVFTILLMAIMLLVLRYFNWRSKPLDLHDFIPNSCSRRRKQGSSQMNAHPERETTTITLRHPSAVNSLDGHQQAKTNQVVSAKEQEDQTYSTSPSFSPSTQLQVTILEMEMYSPQKGQN